MSRIYFDSKDFKEKDKFSLSDQSHLKCSRSRVILKSHDNEINKFTYPLD